MLSGTRENPVEEEKRTKEGAVLWTRHGSGVNGFRPEHDGLVAARETYSIMERELNPYCLLRYSHNAGACMTTVSPSVYKGRRRDVSNRSKQYPFHFGINLQSIDHNRCGIR